MISHELNEIVKRNTLDAIELHIKDGAASVDIPDKEMFVIHGKNYRRITGWAKDNSGREEDYEEFLRKGKEILSLR
jgi:hypothetical protein